MQVVLAIIVLALLAGLVGSLWYVLTNPRRRARRISAELAEPMTGKSSPLIVGYRRGTSAGMAILFAVIAANVVVRGHDAVAVVVLLALLTPVVILFARFAVQTKPVLVIDCDGIDVARERRTLGWGDIATIAIDEGAGLYGVETHTLVLRVAPHAVRGPNPRVTTDSETVTVPLGLLSPNWHQIARAIHELSGRPPVIPAKYALGTSD